MPASDKTVGTRIPYEPGTKLKHILSGKTCIVLEDEPENPHGIRVAHWDTRFKRTEAGHVHYALLERVPKRRWWCLWLA